MSRDISLLKPSVQDMVYQAIAIMKAQSVQYAITSTLRTVAEQQALYAQGRQPIDVVNELRVKTGMGPLGPSDNTYTVTNCDGVKTLSNHQSGCAIDIVPLDKNGNPSWPDKSDGQWKIISDIMKIAGFQWGGDWAKFPDYPHYELKEI